MALFLVPLKSISSFSSPYQGCIKLTSIQDKDFVVSITLGIQWTMLMIVQFPNLVLIILCSMTSVCLLIDAVASSSTKMWLLFTSTQPKQKSCHCPHSLPLFDNSTHHTKLSNKLRADETEAPTIFWIRDLCKSTGKLSTLAERSSQSSRTKSHMKMEKNLPYNCIIVLPQWVKVRPHSTIKKSGLWGTMLSLERDHSSQLLLCWCHQWGYSHQLVQLSWKALEWEMYFHFQYIKQLWTSPLLWLNAKPLSTRGESARYLSWNCRRNHQTKNQS
jgi:hypothetical protein